MLESGEVGLGKKQTLSVFGILRAASVLALAKGEPCLEPIQGI